MKSTKRFWGLFWLVTAATLSLTVLGCESSSTVSYPTKNITYICAFGQGGGADSIARALAKATEPHLGKQIEVKNVVGAGGSLGASELAAAKPDGYTVAQQQATVVTIQPHVQPLPYSPDSFQIICTTFIQPYVWVVRSDSPYKTLQDVAADAKAKPDGITFSFTAIGGGGHLAMESLAKHLGISGKLKIVPFDSCAVGVTQLLGGHLDTALGHPFDVFKHIEEGRVRPLATFQAWPGMDKIPGLKTLKELGIDYEAQVWSSNVVPKGTPKDAVEKLRVAFEKGKKEKSFITHMENTMTPIYDKPVDQATADLKSEFENFGPIVAELGLKK